MHQLLGMIEDKSYQNDKKLLNDIQNTNYPKALFDLYEFIEKIYDKELEKRKK